MLGGVQDEKQHAVATMERTSSMLQSELLAYQRRYEELQLENQQVLHRLEAAKVCVCVCVCAHM
jgi:hypothetical protein